MFIYHEVVFDIVLLILINILKMFLSVYCAKLSIDASHLRKLCGLGVVGHACNPGYSEVETGGLQYEAGQLKSVRPCLKK
jgi:hypothetical protein